MDKLIIEGGRPLEGTIRTCGSKNAVLPILAASLLTGETLRITGAPRLADVSTMLDILRDLGADAEQSEDGTIEISAEGDIRGEAPWERVRRMRGSVCVMGPLLTRLGRAKVSLPGGCAFGVRPIDIHLKGLRALGAKVRIEHGYVVCEAPPGGLRGGRVFLGSANGPSVLGTANVVMAATLARGTTTIEQAACEPEIVDLCDCLVSMGAKISGQGSPMITVEGVDELHGAEHPVIPDRIEAGTYVLAGALAGGQVRVENCVPTHLGALLDRMTEARVPYSVGEDWIETEAYDLGERPPRSTDVTTHAYPGFPTDLQAQWMALMTKAEGLSIITERIFSDRWMHVPELERLGAQLRRQNTAVVVRGTRELSGAPVMASDLRASAALVMAGLVARGTTEVHRVYHIDRGYEAIEERLQGIGAAIRREAE
ncbi:MAG: UDP-N-acetylglucosamine 1-carboxyvinyltransferase [Planctomycetota bacterium]|nr:UDP-N-acetylglucosamine 1-carboxyvinyltransferase [Planctomycetota bacterium]